MSTIFTKIIKGEIPCYKIAEDDRFFSFLDIRPVSRGHTLVVPRQETDYVFDLDDPLLRDLMIFAKSIARSLDRVLKPLRTGVLVEGLEVPHAHIHLIPLYPGKTTLRLGRSLEIPSQEMEEIAQALRTDWQKTDRIHLS